MTAARRRVTQQDIARMTGVSQATVSLVLNGRTDADVRIAPETRDRVLQAIRSTGYVADPIARRLAARHNRIIGVFTYEPVFPSGSGDFYHPFLVGIEQCAERLGCDLLLLTSAPVVDGRRRVFHEDNRIRLADGCVLLGRWLDHDELTRLVAEGLPFVSVGRRDDAGGPVPYVGADYTTATDALVHRVVGAGHRQLAYVGQGDARTGPDQRKAPESHADRMAGFRTAVAATGVTGRHEQTADRSPADLVDALLAAGVTAVFAEEYADGVAIAQLARERGRSVPGDLSIVVLGDPVRPAAADVEFSGFRIPRREMGWQAIEVLTSLLETPRVAAASAVPADRVAKPPRPAGEDGAAKRREPAERSDAGKQRLLPCEPVVGATLAPPAAMFRSAE